jgi:hypothetical protein
MSILDRMNPGLNRKDPAQRLFPDWSTEESDLRWAGRIIGEIDQQPNGPLG